jgi:hypothetical protein
MLKSELAHQLRQRQYNYGIVERYLIDALSDDEIIDSYITCADCGHKQVTPSDLQAAIEIATDAHHFFEICNKRAQKHGSH